MPGNGMQVSGRRPWRWVAAWHTPPLRELAHSAVARVLCRGARALPPGGTHGAGAWRRPSAPRPLTRPRGTAGGRSAAAKSGARRLSRARGASRRHGSPPPRASAADGARAPHPPPRRSSFDGLSTRRRRIARDRRGRRGRRGRCAHYARRLCDWAVAPRGAFARREANGVASVPHCHRLVQHHHRRRRRRSCTHLGRPPRYRPPRGAASPLSSPTSGTRVARSRPLATPVRRPAVRPRPRARSWRRPSDRERGRRAAALPHHLLSGCPRPRSHHRTHRICRTRRRHRRDRRRAPL